MLRIRHLKVCFGKGNKAERRACQCPNLCRQLCARTLFDPDRSPRGANVEGRSFTPIPNDLFQGWGPPGEPEPSDGVKLTYLLLVSRTIDGRHWVLDSVKELAAMRRIGTKTLRKQINELKRLGFIASYPARELSATHNMNEHLFFLRDMPRWYRTPQDVGAEEERLAEREEGRTLRALDRELDVLARRRPRHAHPRRAVDIGKVKMLVAARKEAQG